MLLLCCFFCLCLTGCASQKSAAPKLILRYADDQPMGYPNTVAAEYFADLVRERTQGNVVVKVYDESKLGDQVSVFRQMQFGGIDFARVTVSTLAEFAPVTGVLQMPYQAAKYYVLDYHTRVPELLLASADVMSQLSDEDVEIIKQCALETEQFEKDRWAEKEVESERIVREAGCVVTELTPEAQAEFMAAMTEPSDVLGGKSLYEKYGADFADIIEAIQKLGEQF